jgi:hypothetical protein
MTGSQTLLRVLADEVSRVGGRLVETGGDHYAVHAPPGRDWVAYQGHAAPVVFRLPDTTRYRRRRTLHRVLSAVRRGWCPRDGGPLVTAPAKGPGLSPSRRRPVDLDGGDAHD